MNWNLETSEVIRCASAKTSGFCRRWSHCLLGVPSWCNDMLANALMLQELQKQYSTAFCLFPLEICFREKKSAKICLIFVIFTNSGMTYENSRRISLEEDYSSAVLPFCSKGNLLSLSCRRNFTQRHLTCENRSNMRVYANFQKFCISVQTKAPFFQPHTSVTSNRGVRGSGRFSLTIFFRISFWILARWYVWCLLVLSKEA